MTAVNVVNIPNKKSNSIEEKRQQKEMQFVWISPAKQTTTVTVLHSLTQLVLYRVNTIISQALMDYELFFCNFSDNLENRKQRNNQCPASSSADILSILHCTKRHYHKVPITSLSNDKG